jgi:hypothetical protein
MLIREPPPAAADMPGQVKGEGGLRGMIPGRTHLDPPDLVIHQARPASEWRPAFLGPPLAAFVPADGVSADRVAPAVPVEAQGLAGRRADDIHGLAENAHVASRPSPGWSRPSSRFDFLRFNAMNFNAMNLFEHIFE